MPVKYVGIRRLLTLAVVASLFMTVLPATPASAATEGEMRNRLYELVNNKRAALGLRKLRINDKTQYWAKDHARWMANNESLTHDSSDEMWAEVPSRSQYRSENIAWMGPADLPGVIKSIHNALLASPGHRANLLASRTTHMGFGVVKKDGRVWVVQRFVDRRW